MMGKRRTLGRNLTAAENRRQAVNALRCALSLLHRIDCRTEHVWSDRTVPVKCGNCGRTRT